MKTSTERRLGALIASVQAGDCVLVLGPRIAAPEEVAAEPGLCIADDLARKLITDLGEPTEGRGLLRAIAQYERRRCSAQACRSMMQQLVAEYADYTTPLHLELARLPFRLVVSATFDVLMAQAFRQAGKCDVVEAHYDFRPPSLHTPLLKLPTFPAPIVYSLFGNVAHPESMVLNEQNLLDYLVAVTREQPPLPDAVRATLRAPSTVFLFIGFGFENWWLRLLLKVLQITGVENRPMSLALEEQKAFEDASMAESQGFFGAAGIDIVPGNWNDVVQVLRASVKDPLAHRPPGAPFAGSGDVGAATGTRDAPLVFLSYASEDRETVNWIRSGLAQRGVSVWHDKTNLRAGQQWLAQVEQVIKRVNFFVFIQTPQMDVRDALGTSAKERGGEYNEELKLALVRQRKLPGGATYLVHITAGVCRERPESELKAVHRITVDDEAGLDRLAADLLKNFRQQREAA